MNPRDALLQAIGANRLELAPRLIFADYLEETGQFERAELIRLQCQLSANPDLPFPDRLNRLIRIEQLLDQHYRRWHIADYPKTDFESYSDFDLYSPRYSGCPPFRNGSLDTVWLGEVSGNVPHFPQFSRNPFPNEMMRQFTFSRLGIAEKAWQEYVNFTRFPDGWSDYPDLFLVAIHFDDTAMHLLQRMMPAHRLQRLETGFVEFETSARETFARWLGESAIQRLKMEAQVNDATLAEYFRYGPFRQLTHLQLRGSGQLGELTLRQLIDHGISQRLESLLCARMQCSGAALRLLANRDDFPNLRELGFTHCQLNADDLRLLTRRGSFPQLRRLLLDQNRIRDEGFHHLILFGHWPHLRHLEIGECGLTEEAFRPLNLADFAESLESIDLLATDRPTPSNETSSSLLRTIAAAELPRLAHLKIGTRSIPDRPWGPILSRIPSLASLNIIWDAPRDQWKPMVFDHLELPQLQSLQTGSEFSLDWLNQMPPTTALPQLARLGFDRYVNDRESEQFRHLSGRPTLSIADIRLGLRHRE
ncbi:TIGR02996 domain-containing protein [Tuwongella immobilis]|uniref:Repeat-companion domain protein n=1 Tax=Tuwongella immobilis TaxID=692036 RepID=A0A6C2YJU3_9BACT|nr:TIGR02996 domain-containing protein [Tuwongella immobilis]VIP01850.1 unnamed protein product [Tuwongella immobilis]VTR99638.1 unnamed protein product [Tuwongella immobilis]